MTRVQPGIQINQELWNKAKSNYDNSSQRIEELIQEDLELENYENKPIKLLTDLGLTTKQERLLDRLIEDDRKAISRPDIGQLVRKHSIYSRKDHIKNAVKAIDRNRNVPFEIQGGKMVESEIRCGSDDCDATFTLTVLDKTEMECPNCGQGYEL